MVVKSIQKNAAIQRLNLAVSQKKAIRDALDVYYHGLNYAVSFCSQIRHGCRPDDIRGWRLDEPMIRVLWDDFTGIVQRIADASVNDPILQDTPYRFLRKAIRHVKVRRPNEKPFWLDIGHRLPVNSTVVEVEFKAETKHIPFDEVIERLNSSFQSIGIDFRTQIFTYQGFPIQHPAELLNHIFPERAELASVKAAILEHRNLMNKTFDLGINYNCPCASSERLVPDPAPVADPVTPVETPMAVVSPLPPVETPVLVETDAVPFSAARREMIIYEDRVTVCGIEVWRDCGQSDMRNVFIRLMGKEGGGYVRVKGSALMVELGRCASNSIGRPIKSFRDNATARLKEHRNLDCGPNDIIGSSGGYHFTDWLDVRIDDGSVPSESEEPTLGVEPVEEQPVLNARQKWIVEQLGMGSTLRHRDIVKQWKVSRSTINRDLKGLRSMGLIVLGDEGIYVLTKAE